MGDHCRVVGMAMTFEDESARTTRSKPALVPVKPVPAGAVIGQRCPVPGMSGKTLGCDDSGWILFLTGFDY